MNDSGIHAKRTVVGCMVDVRGVNEIGGSGSSVVVGIRRRGEEVDVGMVNGLDLPMLSWFVV